MHGVFRQRPDAVQGGGAETEEGLMATRPMELPVFAPDEAAQHLGLRREDVLYLAGMFLQDVKAWRETLETVAVQPDLLRAAAHRLKGEAANLGAQALRAAAFALESAILSGSCRVQTEELRLALLAELEAFAQEMHDGWQGKEAGVSKVTD